MAAMMLWYVGDRQQAQLLAKSSAIYPLDGNATLASVAFTGTGVFAPASAKLVPQSVAFSGTGVLAPSVGAIASVAFTADGTFAPVDNVLIPASVTFTATGIFSPNGSGNVVGISGGIAIVIGISPSMAL